MTTVTCKECGVLFEAESKQRKFCPRCVKRRDCEQAKLRYLRRKQKDAARQMNGVHTQSSEPAAAWKSLNDKFDKKCTGPSVSEIARAAAKAGMTYGKYVAKYGDKWQ